MDINSLVRVTSTPGAFVVQLGGDDLPTFTFEPEENPANAKNIAASITEFLQALVAKVESDLAPTSRQARNA